jgi:hypothetical protein
MYFRILAFFFFWLSWWRQVVGGGFISGSMGMCLEPKPGFLKLLF